MVAASAAGKWSLWVALPEMRLVRVEVPSMVVMWMVAALMAA